MRRGKELMIVIDVVDIQGMIGTATAEEIRFAEKQGKEIFYHSAYDL